MTYGEYLHLMHCRMLYALDMHDWERLDQLIAARDRAMTDGVPTDEQAETEAEAA